MTTRVVGGTYWEFCVEPDWESLVGSGFRAAAVLAGSGHSISLTTRIWSHEERLLRIFAASEDIDLDLTVNDDPTISFDYPTPLSQPLIRPTADGIRRVHLRACADLVVAFGMLDADVEISASVVVFDPQSASPRLPVGIEESKQCAVIANIGQISALGEDPEVQTAARNVARRANAEVVVVKKGLSGADVYFAGEVLHVPAYRSPGAFTIGSGDVFSAVFARCWAIEKLPPHESSEIASKAVARYAHTRSLGGLETSSLMAAQFEPIVAVKGVVYLAAPFFDIGQLLTLRLAEEALREVGLRVVSPLREVGRGSANVVAPADLALLRKCDRVFALLNNLDPGTVFETGYARDRGLAVVGYAPHLYPPHRTMFDGTGIKLFDDFSTAIVAVATL